MRTNWVTQLPFPAIHTTSHPIQQTTIFPTDLSMRPSPCIKYVLQVSVVRSTSTFLLPSLFLLVSALSSLINRHSPVKRVCRRRVEETATTKDDDEERKKERLSKAYLTRRPCVNLSGGLLSGLACSCRPAGPAGPHYLTTTYLTYLSLHLSPRQAIPSKFTAVLPHFSPRCMK